MGKFIKEHRVGTELVSDHTIGGLRDLVGRRDAFSIPTFVIYSLVGVEVVGGFLVGVFR